MVFYWLPIKLMLWGVILWRLVALPLTASMEGWSMYVDQDHLGRSVAVFVMHLFMHMEKKIMRLCLLYYHWPVPCLQMLLVAAVVLTQGHSCPNPFVSTRLSAFRPAVRPLLVPRIPSSVLAPTTLSNLVQFELVFAGMLCKNVSNLRILYFY